MLPDYLEILERRDRRVARRAARGRSLRAPFVALSGWLSAAWGWGTSVFADSGFDDDDEIAEPATNSLDEWQDDDRRHADLDESQSSGGSAYEPQDFSDSSINPATGLAMVGALDVEGNPYGCSETEWSGTDSADCFHSSEW